MSLKEILDKHNITVFCSDCHHYRHSKDILEDSESYFIDCDKCGLYLWWISKEQN